MKKVLILAAVAVLSVGSIYAQNKFRGVITYSVTSTGENFYQVPEQYATAEVKVFDQKVRTSSSFFTGNPMANSVLVDGLKQYVALDLSMLMMYLSQNDVELSYTGSSKILVTREFSQQDIDSLTIPVTEGFYIEYVDETKTIQGFTAKKAILHSFNDEGEDHPTTMWYSDEMGPEVNFLFNGLKGVALEYVMNLGDGQQLTLTATEIKKGKVKEVDMLLPAGYDAISNEDFTALFKEINEELEYLRED